MSTTWNSAADAGSDVWARTKAIAGEALELHGTERAAFVAEACGGNRTLLHEVMALLSSHDTAGGALSDQGVPGADLAEALACGAVGAGSIIGRYRVTSMLGAGGMGSVFEAVDPALSRSVAIKLLAVGVASTGARRRFQAEAAALARLDHPNVARVYEVGVHEAAGQLISMPYYAMELVRGGTTVDRFVREQRLGVREIVKLFVRVCDAVHHGHQKAVLHRDIKPGNVLVDEGGVPKVIDFGVARLLDRDQTSGQTMAGEFVGTPGYLPPEAFTDGVSSLDTRADVYGLGVTLYELLAGRPAFDVAGLAPSGAGRVVCTSAPADLGNVNPGCKGDVATIVHKAMAREVSDRYQSADQFAADLERVLRFEPIAARRVSLVQQARLFAKRNRVLVTIVGVCVAAVLVGATGLGVGFTRARASERRAVAEAERARQVAEFVTNMMRSANPFPLVPPVEARTGASEVWRSAARTGTAPSVGDVLVGAMPHVEKTLESDPALAAELALLLADTGRSVADDRATRLAGAAHQIVHRAHGPNDSRTLLALIYRIAGEHNAGILGSFDETLGAVRELVRRDEPAFDQATTTGLSVLAAARVAHLQRDTWNLVRERRAKLDARGAADTSEKLTLDCMLLELAIEQGERVDAGERYEHLVKRGKALGLDYDEGMLVPLYSMQRWQRSVGDLTAAQQTLMEGVFVSSQRWEGSDPRTYDWWSQVFLVAMQVNDWKTAEFAAREQLRGARAMLGPHSSYTTKAAGRVARALLARGGAAASAERFAREALSGAEEQLAIHDGWAVYHELLLAWALRAQGDAGRAKLLIEARWDAAIRAGRTGDSVWVELFRLTQLAACELDLLEQSMSTPAAEAVVDVARLRWIVEQANCYGDQMGEQWPATPLARQVRDRMQQLLGRAGSVGTGRASSQAT